MEAKLVSVCAQCSSSESDFSIVGPFEDHPPARCAMPCQPATCATHFRKGFSCCARLWKEMSRVAQA